MLCILYVNVVSALLGLAALLTERALPDRAPRRWLWAIVVALSVILPPVYRARHNHELSAHAAHTATNTSGTTPAALLDPDWWARTEAYNPVVMQVWGLSSRALLVWGAVSAIWVAAVVLTSRRRRAGGAGPAVVDGVPVLVTKSLGPATVGLGRSRVLIPRWVLALPGAQRRYVVRHEEEHRRAHDAQLLMLASIPLVLIPWNLALWWALRRLRLAVEMDCDNRVVSALGDAPAYGELLVKVAEASNRGPRLQPAFLGGVGMLERRLRTLLAPPDRGVARRFLAPAIACALLILALALPHPVVALP